MCANKHATMHSEIICFALKWVLVKHRHMKDPVVLTHGEENVSCSISKQVFFLNILKSMFLHVTVTSVRLHRQHFTVALMILANGLETSF